MDDSLAEDVEYDPTDFDDVEYVRCKFCNKGRLIWTQTREGWRLADDDGNIHSCQRKTKPGLTGSVWERYG